MKATDNLTLSMAAGWVLDFSEGTILADGTDLMDLSFQEL